MAARFISSARRKSTPIGRFASRNIWTRTIAVSSAAALHDELTTRGAVIARPLEDRPWSCRDFYIEDPDGYVLCFSEENA